MLLVKFIIKTGKQLFECGVKASLINKKKIHGRNGGGFSKDSKLLNRSGSCIG